MMNAPAVKGKAVQNITVTRQTDAKFINMVANHPSVYDWVRGPLTSELDLRPIVEDISNVLLAGEHGVMMFIHKQMGVYEVHTAYLPEGRGEWGLEFAKKCFKWMFTRTPAIEINTRVPKGNLGALTLTRAMGMEKETQLKNGWILNDAPIPASVWSISVQKWLRDTGDLDRGKWFVNHLAAEFAKHGSEQDYSEVPEDHLSHIGGAIEMIFGGQKEKGVIFYNRWAGMTGVLPLNIVTLNPLVIECQGALLKFRPNDFWIMSCP